MTTKAVWIPFMDFQEILTGKTEERFTDSIKKRFEIAAEFGINCVFAHVRPFGDALYRSFIFPASYLISGREGDPLAFDPLEIMIREAHAAKIRLEAWINPFRVRNTSLHNVVLSDSNPAIPLLKSGGAIKHQLGIAYNPASEEACELIVNGIREICENYDVDGIHFDDYFYPVTDPFFDMDWFNRYKAPGGGLSQKQWRRENITLFLEECYRAIHEYPNGRFGLSPKGYMECNLEEEFLDVPRILSKDKYVDYICPQAYFAMSDEVCQFSAVMDEFDKLIRENIELIAGLAVYKIGHDDKHAGVGREEWLNGESILAHMVEYSKKTVHYGGYALYNFKTAFLPEENLKSRITVEMEQLKRI